MTIHNRTPRSARLAAVIASTALAVAAFGLSGCATTTAQTPPAQAAPDAASVTAGEAVTVVDAWAKAAESGMSAAFGHVTNSSDHDVTIVSATSEASSMIELHETVESDTGEMMMREIDGGFVIPAGETLVLEPGGNHLMLMDLTAPLVAGDEITFVLTFDDESTGEFTAPVKDFSGANENYEGQSHSDMDQ
ncbi:copper chaperone PCu(A)C [Microbacterium immunditiarum]|uniref:Copper chaperone PCu(A)C n=1 Tax=Microbacterium immunditiarum TaxID=337480 RepID=A0A7Y9GMR7_9MICO|nr:copper chaperone PCu(A)C [Microbacterium immunditiarum]NYE19368.1 hypothetical protein [Microbacterium immunditiarum]